MKTCALMLSLIFSLASCPAWANDEALAPTDVRRHIDLRLKLLDYKREQISTTAPKVATFAGIGGLLGGAIAIVVATQGCRSADRSCGDRWGASIAGITLLSVGGVTTLISGIVWGTRVKQRNKIDAERELLIKERNAITESLSRIELNTPFRDGTQFVTLGVRF